MTEVKKLISNVHFESGAFHRVQPAPRVQPRKPYLVVWWSEHTGSRLVSGKDFLVS